MLGLYYQTQCSCNADEVLFFIHIVFLDNLVIAYHQVATRLSAAKMKDNCNMLASFGEKSDIVADLIASYIIKILFLLLIQVFVRILHVSKVVHANIDEINANSCRLTFHFVLCMTKRS